ncbi:hypothetical protein D6817_00830 [Candidatus Pacearchaeota archaeon]|nr:MAG: hypothetical protein D6817_00830 [Candidatus Pacearchaeota archaeon]
MADKKEVVKEKLQYKGLFDFATLYSFSHSWFADKGYGVVEKKYNEKVEGNKRDTSIEWEITKKISDYFRADYTLKIEVSDMTEVEVEIDGERKRMQKGEISIEIKGVLVRDPESKWDESPFYRFLRDLYDKYIIPARIDESESEVKERAITFKEDLKALLEIWGRRPV